MGPRGLTEKRSHAVTGWVINHVRGSAADLFAWEPTGRPEVRLLSVTKPALVLGSTQSADLACVLPEADIVRRRSGGGAVWLDADVVWVDVVVPASHHFHQTDVGRAFHWLGDVWCEAIGMTDAQVHRGPLVRSSWSSLVCFAGLGPGEVRVAGRKVVGISQRRTRTWSLFQSAVSLVWDSARTVRALRLDDHTAQTLDTALRELAAGWPVAGAARVTTERVHELFVAALHTADTQELRA